MKILLLVLASAMACVNAQNINPCENDLYCYGPLLEKIQLAHFYDDNKFFVDKKLLFDKDNVNVKYDDFITQTPDPTLEQLEDFVNENFGNESSQFLDFDPPDFVEDPDFLSNIFDPPLKEFAKKVHGIWNLLGRKMIEDVKNSPDRYSLIYVPNAHIVPGGRFTEFYYWDTYWIIEGLLISGMNDTVKGMLQNFFHMVDTVGFVPNGGRIYFERSQPPLLVPMVKMYLDTTNDTSLLTDENNKNYNLLVKEFDFFWDNRTIEFPFNSSTYKMLRYNVEKLGPRPESFSVDYKLATGLSTVDRDELFMHLKSACESGWDFSSRWQVPRTNQKMTLRDTKTRDIIPVDLNAFFYRAARELQMITEDLGLTESRFGEAAEEIKKGLHEVLWVENEGAWFDYNMITEEHNLNYYASNVATLWANAQHDDVEVPSKVVAYLENTGALNYPGGLPTSLIRSGEQWDFPAAWAPLQELVVLALLNTKYPEAEEMAYQIAEKFVLQTYKTFNNEKYNNTMFEKYDVTVVGEPASGGEYKVVEGFGWTNGVALSFLNRFGAKLRTDPYESEHPPPCDNNLYCYGPLLEKIQLAHFYDDNKFFVDKKLVHDKDVVISNYNDFIAQTPDPTLEQLEDFVNQNFGNESSQFIEFDPPDFDENPEFLLKIYDPQLREFAKKVNGIWNLLGRKIIPDVETNPDRYSLIYVPNAHIVPGGRFTEFYYWDTYWIIEGLLISGMNDTVKGMLQNFFHMVDTVGFVPNGGRIYFERSQPPLLVPMVKMYLDTTNDTSLLTDENNKNYNLLVKEFDFFWDNRTIEFPFNSSTYKMLRYNVEKTGPRPESYSVDYKLATGLSGPDQDELFMHLKSACESGWDFSSRWQVPRTNQKMTLRDTKTRDIIPVDLNAFFYRAARELQIITEDLGLTESRFGEAAEEIKKGLHEVLWVENEGAWFDYNMITEEHNLNYYASNVATLWANAQHDDVEVPSKVVAYLENTGALNYPGGLPTSLIRSGEQWDFPAAWAPLQELVVLALLNTKYPEAEEMAYQIAEKFVLQTYKTFNNEKYNNTMFEKYDVTVVGEPASGGEYKVVEGFGWTNGVALSFLNRFGAKLRADPYESEHPPPCDNNLYCYGQLLHTVQLAQIYDDGKFFVDKRLLFEKDLVLSNFSRFITQFPDPTQDQIESFVDDHFETENGQFVPYDPVDWTEDPKFLENIKDEPLKHFAKSVNKIWKLLGRKVTEDVKTNPHMFSLIYVPNGHIVPGGRFTEFFYWDTYWIMEGLLISGMNQTVKGMLQNFFHMVDTVGFVPNGGRIYFERSQPPLLTPMVKMYLDATNDTSLLTDENNKNYNLLVKEFDFFWTSRTIDFNYNNTAYKMLRYNVEKTGPRPEAYAFEYKLAQGLSTSEKDEMNMNIKSACESGWDFSSRWFVPRKDQKTTLRHTKTRDIIPVDLNAFFYRAANELEIISAIINLDGTKFKLAATEIKKGLEQVLWQSAETGSAWFDYNLKTTQHNKNFYASNLATLWANAQHDDPEIGKKVVDYLTSTGALNYPGGLPTSLIESGQQWDFPAAWAPLQELVVGALLNTKNPQAEEIAYQIAEKFVLQTYKTFNNEKYNHTMFEKYDVRIVGEPGGGGEYEVVEGFGWTNGVALSFLNRFGQQLESEPNSPPDAGVHLIPTLSLLVALLAFIFY